MLEALQHGTKNGALRSAAGLSSLEKESLSRGSAYSPSSSPLMTKRCPLAAFTTNSAGNAIVNTDDGPNKMSAEFIANRIQEEAHDQL
jgi:hypothetical protein